MDETYIGGKTDGRGRAYKGNKVMVLGAIERGGNTRLWLLDEIMGLAI